MTSAIQRVLRSPRVVIAEIAALALAGSVGVLRPTLAVFQTPWFLAIVGISALSLLIAVRDQGRRLLCGDVTARRVGSMMLHLGLIAIIAAGAWRALFSSEAVVDLIEGETLPPAPTAWTHQPPGLLATPFHLTRPITLEALHGSRYPDGRLRDLSATLSAGTVAVNHDLILPGGRIFLDQTFGPAALLEWHPPQKSAVLLDPETRTATATGPDGLTAYLRAPPIRPDHVEVRVMRNNGLLFSGELRPGQTLSLHGGATLTLRGIPLWTRLRGSHDHSHRLAYPGFALILIGCILLFARTAPPQGLRVVASAPLFLSAILLAGCNRTSTEEARQLVLRYNTLVAEAYRRGDPHLIEPVVSLNEGKKLTGLIGVRSDLGLTLDSELLSLTLIAAEQRGRKLRVQTKEQWRYRDRKIGTGEQVGEESSDSYEMLYLFTQTNRTWIVDEIQFTSPPRIGRKQMTWQESRNPEKP